MCFCQIHCDGVGIATKFRNSYAVLPARSINSCVVQMEVPDFISKLNELQDTEPERAANLMTTFANMMEPVAAPLKKTKRRFAKFQAGALAMTTSEESSEYKQTNRNAGGRIKRQKTRGAAEAGRTLNRYRTLAACCFRNDDFSLADVLAATTEYSALSKHERKQWRMNKCLSMNATKKGFGIRTSSGTVTSCCTECFSNFHGFSRSSISRTLALIKDDRVVIPEVVVPNRSLTKQEATAWVTHKYLHFGDYMPDEATICLPVFDKKELHVWYTTSEDVYKPYKIKEFNKLLRDQFPFITFRRCTKFMQCAWCNKVDIKISKTRVRTHFFHYKYIEFRNTGFPSCQVMKWNLTKLG